MAERPIIFMASKEEHSENSLKTGFPKEKRKVLLLFLVRLARPWFSLCCSK